MTRQDRKSLLRASKTRKQAKNRKNGPKTTVFGPGAAETTKGAKNTKIRTILPQRPQRKQRGMLEQPGSVVGRGDDPAGFKKASSERPKPEQQAKNRQNRPQNADFRARSGQNYEMRERHEKRTILPQSLPSRRHGPPRGAERSENGFLARHFRKNSVGRDSKGGNFVLGKMGGVSQSPQNMRRIRRPIAAKTKIAQKTGF